MTIQIEDKYLENTGLTGQFVREELALLLFDKGILNVEQASGLAQKDLLELQAQKKGGVPISHQKSCTSTTGQSCHYSALSNCNAYPFWFKSKRRG